MLSTNLVFDEDVCQYCVYFLYSTSVSLNVQNQNYLIKMHPRCQQIYSNTFKYRISSFCMIVKGEIYWTRTWLGWLGTPLNNDRKVKIPNFLRLIIVLRGSCHQQYCGFGITTIVWILVKQQYLPQMLFYLIVQGSVFIKRI